MFVTVHDAGEGVGERHGEHGDGDKPARANTVRFIAPVIKLGSKDGAAPAQTIDARHQGASLFL